MSVIIEKLGNSKVEMTVDVSAAKLKEGIDYSYNKNKNNFSVPGFRKGKVPKQIIEKTYGFNIFYDDAVNFILNDVYQNALEESNLDVVSQPDIDILEINEETGVVFKFTVITKPDVILGQYKNIEISKQEETVDDSEIEKELQLAQEKNSRLISITDRAVKNGDLVTIDFKGYIDNDLFDGGEADDYDLLIGSHTFIDTFEDQLIGSEIGSNVEVNVSFPENYGREELNGKPVVFDVLIKDIKEKELPLIDDEFAQDISEFNTLDEYKSSIREKLFNKKVETNKLEKENNLLTAVIKNCEIDIPDVMIENETDSLIEQFEGNLRSQGLQLDIYLTYVGQNKEDFRNSLRKQAISNVSGRLILAQICKEENIIVADDELNEYIKKLFGIKEDDLETYKERLKKYELSFIEEELMIQKAMDLIVQTSIEV